MTTVVDPPIASGEDLHGETRALAALDGPFIVAVDGSDRTRDSLALAARLAEPGQQLVLVYVHPYRELGDPMVSGTGGDLVRDIAESTLAALPDTLGHRSPVDMRLVSAGSAAVDVHRIARDTGAGLIVVASSRRAGLARVLDGSVAESIAFDAPVPVAFAPPGYAGSDAALATIGSAFDGSDESQQALAWAAAIAAPRSAHLRVLAVHDPIAFGAMATTGALGFESANYALRRRLARGTREALASLPDRISASYRLLDGDPVDQLVAASADLDLLVVGSRGHGPIRRIFSPSVSRALVRSAASPVVVI